MAKSRYNIDRLRKKFKEFENIAKQDIKNILSESAKNIVNQAKRKAPANYGKVRQSIDHEPKNEGFKQVIFVGEVYGAFVEFGTKTYVNVPPELQSEALKFKGYKSGNLDEFFENILDWVKRKNIGGTYSIKTRKKSNSKESLNNQSIAAWFIAMSILKKGIKPQPYLWPAFIEERPKIPIKIDKILQRSAKEFNKD